MAYVRGPANFNHAKAAAKSVIISPLYMKNFHILDLGETSVYADASTAMETAYALSMIATMVILAYLQSIMSAAKIS